MLFRKPILIYERFSGYGFHKPGNPPEVDSRTGGISESSGLLKSPSAAMESKHSKRSAEAEFDARLIDKLGASSSTLLVKEDSKLLERGNHCHGLNGDWESDASDTATRETH